jgi:tetratricopeptide (TPR) repeat protein
MTPTTPPPDTAPDERHAAALHEYQSALELGLPLDRAALLARYPDLPHLAADLDALDELHRAGAELNPLAAAGPPPGTTLADFEMVREVGRGGMGVVYEATQRSLGRRVAVKVLTLAAALDDRARLRFLHEARSAALVEHPNVVPVYHVGEDNGVPFYVMPFVPGRPLGRPGPPSDGADPFEWVARVGAQAADGLAAAHAAGVIHRDVKPANLLLDDAGKVWVTDFGLAVAPLTDGLTRTGARPGTPRYMSPEQLTGRRDQLDGRTDVYSLGVTLYELATGRPAFDGSDEHTLVVQITATRPPPPGLLAPGIPHDLETVILKAMARDPADRYATAGELAADLRRFLDHRPVLARRPGAVHRFRKWLRRNRRSVLAAGGLITAGLIVGLAGSTYWAWRAYRAEADRRQRVEEKQKLIVRLAAPLSRASDEILAHAAGMQDRQLKYLTECVALLDPYADDPELPPATRRDIAWFHHRLGAAQTRTGRYAEAEASLRTLIARLTPLVEAAPEDPELRKNMAEAYRYLGHLATDRGDLVASRDAFRTAVSHAKLAFDRQPGAATAIVVYHENRCFLADREEALAGTPGSSIPHRKAALEAFEALRERYPTGHPLSYMRLASQRGALAVTYERIGDHDAAERELRIAVGHDEHLVREFAYEPPDIRESSVHLRAALGLLMIRRGNAAGGLPELRRGVADQKAYVAKYPAVRHARGNLTSGYSALAHAEAAAGNAEAARAASKRCAEMLADPDPPAQVEFRIRAHVLLPDHRDTAAAERLLNQPGAVVAPWVRAVVLYRLGRFADARPAAEADPSPPGLLLRAACLAKLGDATARAAFDAAARDLAARPLREPEWLTLHREVAELFAR